MELNTIGCACFKTRVTVECLFVVRMTREGGKEVFEGMEEWTSSRTNGHIPF